jgi:SAM-dependent methyltransferase
VFFDGERKAVRMGSRLLLPSSTSAGTLAILTHEAMEPDWREIFNSSYAGPASRVQERVWREVFGPEYPQDVDPSSYVTRGELARFVRELRVRGGDTLVDVGCGRGGPSLWIATATRASLIGIDIAENALEPARERAMAMGLEGRARFRQGTFDDTGLEAGAADAVMSIDALLFAPDKSAALSELRRILRSGGRLVFTSWDYHRQPVGRPPQVDDHRPMLVSSGFEVLVYDETEDWFARQKQTTAGLLAAVHDLAAEGGDDPEETRRLLEEMDASFDAMSRRIFVVAVARRRPSRKPPIETSRRRR